MEPFVGSRRRPHDEVVRLPARECEGDPLARGPVLTPSDQEAAFGVRVCRARGGKDLRGLHAVPDDDQRDVVAGVAQRVQAGDRLVTG